VKSDDTLLDIPEAATPGVVNADVDDMTAANPTPRRFGRAPETAEVDSTGRLCNCEDCSHLGARRGDPCWRAKRSKAGCRGRSDF